MQGVCKAVSQECLEDPFDIPARDYKMSEAKGPKVKRRYYRIAWTYDFMEGPMEAFLASKW